MSEPDPKDVSSPSRGRRTLFTGPRERIDDRRYRAIVFGQKAICDVLEGFCPACQTPLTNGFCSHGCGRRYEAKASGDTMDATVTWAE